MQSVKHAALALALSVFAVAVPARLSAQKANSEEAIMLGYSLTMPKVDAWVKAATEMAGAAKNMKQKPAQEDSGNGNAIDGIAAQLNDEPEIRRAIRKSGLTTREYTIISMVLLTTIAADEIMKDNPGAERPTNVSAANLAFVRAHKAEVTERMKTVQRLGVVE